MTSNPATQPAQNTGYQLIHFVRKTINFNDANIAAPVDPFAKLPMRTVIVDVIVDIEVAFNAVTTNVLTVGTTTANANEIVAAGDVDETVVAATRVTRALGSALALAADINLYAKYTQTGTAATAGKANVVIMHAPDNGS